MASPFNIKKTTQVGRNGFDLSQRHLFGAVPGMLLPVMTEETLPGDSFKLRLDSFTRMRPLNTAAFARFKEYYDFYFCSKDTLWPWYNNMIVNNNEPTALPVASSTNAPKQVPNCDNFAMVDYFDLTAQDQDEMGISKCAGSCILYDLLGYGTYNAQISHTEVAGSGTLCNIMPFAMYQQIYANYYRNPQWERRDVASYNLRRFFGTDSNTFSPSAIPNLFKMRYANWHKDYFMGLYPTQQFGDVSVVSSFVRTNVAPSSNQNVVAAADTGLVFRQATSSTTYSEAMQVISDVSIVELRRAQALQRLKEVTMTNGSSMFQQVKAHYGFELPEGRKDAPEYIGGFDNVVVINDVDATAAGTDGTNTSKVGQIFGKAAAASDPNKTIDFTAKDFGYIMCIYHVEPYLEYDAVGIKKANMKLSAADEFIPEFDKIGFGSLQLQELLRKSHDNFCEPTALLGYTSRYLDLKSSYDRVHGTFMRSSGTTDSSWAIPLSFDYLRTMFADNVSEPVDYRFFKVNPFIANNIMQVTLPTFSNPTRSIEGYEPFMVAANFSIFKTSNMSVDSLPM